MSSCAATASLRSTSQRFSHGPVYTAPDPGVYYNSDYDTMAFSSSSRRQSQGSFGGRSARDMPWQKSDMYESSTEAPVRSTFHTPRNAAPSAAFATSTKGRFAAPKEGTPGPGAYASARAPLQNTNRLNRSSSFGGRSKRFGVFGQDDTPAPGSFEPKKSAFAAPGHRPNHAGFGSRSSRGSPFVAVSGHDAPPPGAYDANSGGAFPHAASTTPRKQAPSASFSSRSSRFDRPGTQAASQGPDPTAYNAAAYGSMAKDSGKTFNKLSARGGGGFGTSAARPDLGGFVNKEATPGPGQYDENKQQTVGGPKLARSNSRPSSAFASKTANHDSYLKKTDAPPATEYDAYERDSMAAMARKSFNKNAGKGGFGSRAPRPLGANGADDTPAPWSYTAQDPLRPTVNHGASSARGRPAKTAFGATATRDTSRWAAPAEIY